MSHIDRLTLSFPCRQFVEVWNNGNRIRTHFIGGDLPKAVADAQAYVTEWTGSPAELSKELLDATQPR